MRSIVVAACLAGVVISGPAAGQAPAAPAPVLAATLHWTSPPGNPALQAAWVLGSEGEAGSYVLRVRMAAGGKIAPHSHPDTRHTTVLSGTAYVGFGLDFDEGRVVAVPAGAVYAAPSNTPHYIWARDGEIVYQESGVGPTATTFLTISAGPGELRPAAPFIREGSYNQDPQGGKLKGRMLRIKRPLLIVHDLAKSIEFYVDVVGLELYSVEPTYDRRPDSLGYQMFNIDAGSRKRMALLNTADEIRGMTLQEVRDMNFTVQQRPRTSTILFETDDLLALRDRAAAAGYPVIEPVLADIPSTDKASALRFMEFGIVDPDGHVVSFFQYFDDDAEWEAAKAIRHKLDGAGKN
jgi:quercetin dioxygenase-like cupin family protein/catechol 2,3-dioxygenase-like lactoylglutathione lyase family enzyme